MECTNAHYNITAPRGSSANEVLFASIFIAFGRVALTESDGGLVLAGLVERTTFPSSVHGETQLMYINPPHEVNA